MPVQIFDFGTAVVYPDPFAMHHAVDQNLEEHHPSEAPHLAEQRPHNYRGNITKAATDTRNYEYRWERLVGPGALWGFWGVVIAKPALTETVC